MKTKKEFLVGLFILSTIIILGLFLLTFDKLKLKKKYYLLKVTFTDVNNLELGTPVLLGGVKVGKVEKIYLLENKVIVEIYVKKGIKIHKKAKVSITLKGVIGDLIVNIYDLNTGGDYYKEGDILTGIDPISLNVLTEKLYITMALLEDITEKVNEFSFEDGEKVFKNIHKISKKIDTTINKTNELIENTNKLINENKKNLNAITTDSKKLLEKLNLVLDENNNNINEVISNTLEITNMMKIILKDKEGNIEDIVLNLKNISEKLLNIVEKVEKSNVKEKVKEIDKIIKNVNDITEDLKIKLKGTDDKKVKKIIENTEEITLKIKKVLNNNIEIIPELEIGNKNKENLNMNLNMKLMNRNEKYYLKLSSEKIGFENQKNKIFIGKNIKKNEIGLGLVNGKPALDFDYNYNKKLKINFNYYDFEENNVEIKTSIFLDKKEIYLKYDLEKIFYIGTGYKF